MWEFEAPCGCRDVALEQSPAVYTSLLGSGHRRGPDAWRVATAAADGLCGVFSRAQVRPPPFSTVPAPMSTLIPLTSVRSPCTWVYSESAMYEFTPSCGLDGHNCYAMASSAS